MQQPEWWFVNCVRLGYADEAAENPVVVRISVYAGAVQPQEGNRVVDLISQECTKYVLLFLSIDIL